MGVQPVKKEGAERRGGKRQRELNSRTLEGAQHQLPLSHQVEAAPVHSLVQVLVQHLEEHRRHVGARGNGVLLHCTRGGQSACACVLENEANEREGEKPKGTVCMREREKNGDTKKRVRRENEKRKAQGGSRTEGNASKRSKAESNRKGTA